ncbi:hypothetical protein CBF27_10760 [Vagococcus acidifermentans]|uniref:N-acetyltransferase domain-containing protein n=2 Tax=Vagococcus acidifermentans TaxID=564710 RepID=A0A430APZ0_9ENTE|nr:hypothetical protein CBF27_10760 [Vagococcus acidifermentans]
MNMHNKKMKNALNYLSRDKMSHVDMLQSIASQKSDIILATNYGVLLHDKRANLYLLSVDSKSNMNEFLDKFSSPQLLSVHQDFLADEISKRFGLSISMVCKQAVWGSSLDSSHLEYAIIQPLNIQHLDKVYALYSHKIGKKYLQKRIQSNNLFGYFENDELVAFIGLHEEGSMGMLEVKSEFRNRVIGSKLLLWLVNELIEHKKVPFSQIEIDNQTSYLLHEKLGFEFSDGFVYWLE